MPLNINDEEFEKIVQDAIDSIPDKYASKLNNLAFVVEEEPNDEQRRKLNLHPAQSLYGLYEGVPLTARGSNYSGVLPDKITIFRRPALNHAFSEQQLSEAVKHTVWHEVAHYFGLGHERIYELEADDD